MQTLEMIRRRIGSAEDLYAVVRVMKALAAANIRQSENAVASLVEYSRAVELGLQIALRDRTSATDPEPGVDRRWAVVVFGSDQGMCGSFNEQVASHALGVLHELPGTRSAHLVLAVGARVVGRLTDGGYEVRAEFRQPSTVSAITPAVQELLLLIEALRFEEGIERFQLVHHRTDDAGHQPQALQLLPVDQAWLAQLAGRPWDSRSLPVHMMDWHELLAGLIREHLFIGLYRAFAESMAAENASRLASMQAAEQNIEDHLGLLGQRYHRRRQQAITEELLDIVSGFEMLAAQ
ncbi:MAG: F0F1 ATP synthase subunit gamma [Brooklawnia sp.]|jgi:F-type H+-transporting ATPase subunit gamma